MTTRFAAFQRAIDEAFPLPLTRQGAVAVYRHFDRNGVLMYVGCAAQPRTRQMNHQDPVRRWEDFPSWWIASVVRITVDWYPTQAEGRAAEKAAIAAEAPLCNLQYNLDRGMSDPWIQHTVRYTELAPDRFKDFWR